MSDQDPELKNRLDSVLEAGREYGGIDNIPEAILAIHGYKRVARGRLAPLEYEAQKILQSEQVQEDKETLRPFGKITLEVPVTGEAYVTSLTYPLLTTYLLKYFSHDFPKPLFDRIFPNNHPLHTFVDQVSEYDKGWRAQRGLDSESDEGPLNSGNWDIYYEVQEDYLLQQVRQLYPSEILDEEWWDYGDNTLIDSQDAEQLWQALEKTKSQVSDMDRQYQDYEYNYEWRGEGGTYDRAKFGRDMEYFAGFLEYKGLADASVQVRAADSPRKVVELLREALAQNPTIAGLKNEQSELKARGHNLSTEAEREDYRRKMKELKGEEKQLREALVGLAAFFAVPESICEYVERLVSKIQKNFSISGEEGTIHLVLDANPDPEKDADPGSISGDCTEGNPLPFADPIIPVFNIKVYEDERHFGNIYLLSTQDSKGRKVWHLEAIQMPNKRIGWDKFPKVLVEALSEQAQDRNIDYITVNSDALHISNYDYISHAFMKFAGKEVGELRHLVDDEEPGDEIPGAAPWGFDFDTHDEGDIQIQMPEVPEGSKYSSFQGNGQATLLWSKDKP